jgi:hypothetical protein
MGELIETITSRSTTSGSIRIWGTLHARKPDGKLLGWTVNTWTERGISPHLPPKLHWVPRDGKLYHMHLSIDTFQKSTVVAGEATDIEPHRAAFIKATLGQWEQEWLEEGGKKLSEGG